MWAHTEEVAGGVRACVSQRNRCGANVGARKGKKNMILKPEIQSENLEGSESATEVSRLDFHGCRELRGAEIDQHGCKIDVRTDQEARCSPRHQFFDFTTPRGGLGVPKWSQGGPKGPPDGAKRVPRGVKRSPWGYFGTTFNENNENIKKIFHYARSDLAHICLLYTSDAADE